MVTIEQKLFVSGGKKPWVIEQDKIEHWAFGFVLSFLGMFFSPLFLLGYIFAFGKETYDKYYGTGWDDGDLLATVIGAGTAVVLAIVII